MEKYNVIAELKYSTVVSDYVPVDQKASNYQSEADLEKEFIKLLEKQSYEYLPIHTEQDLIINLRKKLEELNNYQFSDTEWEDFFHNQIANSNDGILEKTRTIQEDNVKILKRDTGETKNITLIDKENIHNNKLQVINQYEENRGTNNNRYDVTILVNGIPMVHIELKARGRALKEAFNQIERYQRESFWSGSGLYQYVQIFIISNGTNTKYYSNTTRQKHVKEFRRSEVKGKRTSNSFEFTSFWTDAKNKKITDLVDFTRTFLAKRTILNILTKYCVFTSDKLLLVMRPYQIVATERIINKIEVSHNYKKQGSVEAGGYIWHTTGSGKTLTSFKTAQLATKLDFIDKVLFVVDRKDLDYQTIVEYNKFAEGSVNGNRNTKKLQEQLENPEVKIIVTTIQKLSEFVKKNRAHPVFKNEIVLIFDECHRSQFGEMHSQIVNNFKKYYMFGFTGTPIFGINANTKDPKFCTTEQAFGERLHTYTIINAIDDGNVLPFKIEYFNTMYAKEEIQDQQVSQIEKEKNWLKPARISKIVEYIIKNFDSKTKRSEYYTLKGKRLNGFNSIFAVSSTTAARLYYKEFEKQIKEKNSDLRIATIFSFAPNEEPNEAQYEENEGFLEDENFEPSLLDKTSKEFLEYAVGKYNKEFNTSFGAYGRKNESGKEIITLDGDAFQNYYKDVSQKMKEREIDILIVVNMFLTGFDATTLNTLWVDKNLKMHGLIQAFSRTNRILNSVKTFGNIESFRNLEKATEDAISTYGDSEAKSIVLLKNFEDYYYGYMDKDGKRQMGYEERIANLLQKYPLNQDFSSESQKKEFVKDLGNILRLRNILTCFDKFNGNEILSMRDFQNYISKYNDIYEQIRHERQAEKVDISDDLVFEIELVKTVSVNIDYIIDLVKKYHASNCQNKEILASIDKAIGSSFELRSKRELIEQFIKQVSIDPMESWNPLEWQAFVTYQEKEDALKLINEERLKKDETLRFIYNSFRDGEIKTIGTEIVKILPPMSMFGGAREKTKARVIEKLQNFFNKYYGVYNNVDPDEYYDESEENTGLKAAEEGTEYKIK